ncbi:hypothetical protein [Dactylosporangium sp. NPDC048998]|uniref:hypothetical protein n=1 Tax=Dactylosporangium sp. NPDC048998 TaxID=3363976 RepID=UPI0037166CE5
MFLGTAVRCALQHHPVYAARHAQLTGTPTPSRTSGWFARTFRPAPARLDVPVDAYASAPWSAGERLTRYGLNLVLLAIAMVSS